jgi:hypothetical protein
MTDPEDLIESRIQLHYAIQCIAATGMALGESRPDGSQMPLAWNDRIQGFITLPLPSPTCSKL